VERVDVVEEDVAAEVAVLVAALVPVIGGSLEV
jgi:hypothetical protein